MVTLKGRRNDAVKNPIVSILVIVVGCFLHCFFNCGGSLEAGTHLPYKKPNNQQRHTYPFYGCVKAFGRMNFGHAKHLSFKNRKTQVLSILIAVAKRGMHPDKLWQWHKIAQQKGAGHYAQRWAINWSRSWVANSCRRWRNLDFDFRTVSADIPSILAICLLPMPNRTRAAMRCSAGVASLAK